MKFFSANDFFIGAYVSTSGNAIDLDGNEISLSSTRWESAPPVLNTQSGVTVNIPATTSGEWTISAHGSALDQKSYLCQM